MLASPVLVRPDGQDEESHSGRGSEKVRSRCAQGVANYKAAFFSFLRKLASTGNATATFLSGRTGRRRQ